MKNKANVAQISNPFLEAFTRNNDLVSFKVLLYIAKSKLNTQTDITKLDKDQVYKVPLHLKQISEFLNADIRTINEAVTRLNKTSINYRRIVNGKDKKTFINLLPKGEINYTDNTLDVWVFGEILQEIYATTKYSYVQTKNFIELKSKHSIRMLLLLERINNFKKKSSNGADIIPKRKRYDLDELNKIFGTNYNSYHNFEKYVLIPAKEDLDKHSVIRFVYIKNKDKLIAGRGRARIVGITIDLINNWPI